MYMCICMPENIGVHMFPGKCVEDPGAGVIGDCYLAASHGFLETKLRTSARVGSAFNC